MIFSRLPKWTIFFLGSLLSLALLSWFNYGKLEQQQGKLAQQYGSMLARNIAQQAQSPALKRDLVSLQVLAENSKKDYLLESITFHSVDNKLLAQAGKTQRQKGSNKKQLSFTAPINLQDSVAGYTTVGINPSAISPQPSQAGTVLAALLLLVAAITSIFIKQSSPEPNNESSDAVTTTAPPEESKQLAAWLVVQSGNLGDLQNQLSAAALEELLAEVNQQLKAILSLYHGELLWVDGDSFHCGFNWNGQNNYDQAVFNAICSTKLLIDLGRSRDGIKLHFKAALLKPALGGCYSDLFSAYRDSKQQRTQLDALPHASLLVDKSLLESTGLRQQLEVREDQQNYYVDAISPPYVELLHKQLKQLQKQTA